MIFEKILTLSIAGTGALLLSAVFAALGRRILSERLKYFIAALPILFFLLPIHTGISFRVERYIKPQTEQIETTETAEGMGTDAADTAETTVNPSVIEPIGEKSQSADIWLILSCVWVAGAGALLVKRVFDTARFSRICREIAAEPPEDVRAVFERIKGKTKAELKCFNGAATPFTAGIIRPTVYVPSVKLSESELEAVLLHELTHVRRRDMLIKTAAELVKIIHFMNPAAYLLTRGIDMYCELSCDEVVMKTFSDKRRRDYGRLILGLMREGGVNSGVCLCGNEKNLKRRIGNMMKTRKSTKFTAALGVCLTAVTIAASAAFAGGVNSDEAQIKILETANFTYAGFAEKEFKTSTVTITADGTKTEDTAGSYVAAQMCHTDGKAVIVHSPVYTGFSADFKAYTDEAEPEHKEAQFEVKMTKYIRTFTDGSDVEGLFTVKQDGAVLGENLHGYINNIVPITPDYTEIAVSIDINGKPLEFFITSEHDNDAYMLYEIDHYENLYNHPDSVRIYYNITSQPFMDKARIAQANILYNETTRRAEFSGVIIANPETVKPKSDAAVMVKPYSDETANDYWIMSYGDMEVLGNTIRGSFYIQSENFFRVDSFTGTITLDKDKITLVSDDGRYIIEGSADETMNQAAITPSTMSVLNGDHTINWSNIVELRQKGEAMTWSDFEKFKSYDISNAMSDNSETTLVYKVDEGFNEPYQVILKGSKSSKPSVTLQNTDTGAVMDLRGDGSIYDFVSAN